jgi:Flp pilus assembly protein TadB
MIDEKTSAAAERLSRRRARILPVLAILFLTQQASYFMGQGFGTGDRAVDHVRITAWLALSTVLLLALTTGGGWIYRREVRDLANDESTRAHRDNAFRWGFIVTITAALCVYVVSMAQPLGAGEAIHVIVTAGMLTALLRFGYLERRALRHG